MKILMIKLLLLPLLLMAGPEVQSLSQISKALGEGDVTTLTNYLDTEVELSVLGMDDFYSKGEASSELKSFFASHTAARFSQIHNGVSPTTKSEYCIGNLEAGGKTFRVVIYLNEVNGMQKIKKMSIDQE